MASIASFAALVRPIRQQRWHLRRPALSLPLTFAGLTAVMIVMPATASATPAPSRVAALHFAATTPTGAPSDDSARQHPGPLRVMIVGDSVASSLATGMIPLQSPAGIVVSNQGYIGCGIARGGNTSFKAYTQPAACLTWPERWQGLVANFYPDVTLVLLGRCEVLDRVHDGRWITAPCNNHELADLASPGRLPADDQHRVDLFNQLQQQTVANHPGQMEMVWCSEMLCPGGQFQRNRNGVPPRTSDGVHVEALSGRLLIEQLMPQVFDWLRNPATT